MFRGRLLLVLAAVLGGLCLATEARAQIVDVDFDVALFVVDEFLDFSQAGAALAGSDNDGNGILEEDQLGMLSALLRDAVEPGCINAGTINEIRAGYASNKVTVKQELVVNISGVGTVDIVESLGENDPVLGVSLQNLLAGYMTIADTSTIDFVNAVGDSAVVSVLTGTSAENQIASVQNQISFSAGAFKTFGNAPSEANYLGPAGNIDGDAESNLEEYLDGAIPKAREVWLVDNCLDASLRFTHIQGGGLKVSGSSESFSVTVAGAQGPVSYQWRKGTPQSSSLVGTTDTFTIPFLNAGHTGSYFCIATDGQTTRETPPAELTVVVVPIYIAQSPASATKQAGRAHTFSVIAQGGTPGPYQYEWRKNNVPIGVSTQNLTIDPITPSDAGSYRVRVTSNGGGDTVQSASATLMVRDLDFTVDSEPADVDGYFGQYITLSVSASGGTGVFVYDWRKNGQSIGLVNLSSLLLGPLDADDAALYDCGVADILDPTDVFYTRAARVRVEDRIAITQQPVGATLNVGASFQMEVSATGGYAPLNYQWEWFGIPIPGQTGPSYSNIALSGFSGDFTCRVTDQSTDSEVSDIAELAVVPTVTFLSQPLGAIKYSGESHTFDVMLGAGLQNPDFEWRKDGGPTPALNQPEFTIESLMPGDSGSYDVRVSADNVEGALSDNAILQVADFPRFVTQPQGALITEGSNHTFTISATGGFPPTALQWKKDGEALNGATGNSYAVTGAASEDSGAYSCTISDSNGTVVSSSMAPLSVVPAVLVDAPPVPARAHVGGTAQFSVSASGGVGVLNYQWRKGTQPIGAPNNPVLTLSDVTLGSAGNYSCRVSDVLGNTKTSAKAALSVAEAPIAAQQPEDALLFPGQSTSFSFALSGGFQPYSFQWFKDDVLIEGATDAALMLSGVMAGDSGNYHCVASDDLGFEVISDTAELMVAPPLDVELQPASADRYAGDDHTFTVVVTGGFGDFTYDWQKDEISLDAPSLPALELTALTLGDEGAYTTLVTDEGDAGVQTDPAALRIAEHLTITRAPEAVETIAGGTAIFSVETAGGFAPLHYQWRRNGADIAGATDAALQLDALTPAQAGTYRCEVRDALSDVITTPGAQLSVQLAEGEGEEVISEGEGEGEGEGEEEGEGAFEGEGRFEGGSDGEGEGAFFLEFQTGDQNQDNIISLSELLRIIQFFSSGAYYCEDNTEDGYRPGNGDDFSCRPHSADYNPQDWSISLSELLRTIQFYSTGGYVVCPDEDTEDGFCPVAPTDAK